MKVDQVKSDINNKIQEQEPRDFVILAMLIYLIIGVFLLKYYRYQINPDGISYISIAKKYLAGNFSEAINGYWGPLFCWLLVPLLAIGTEPLLATKILNLLVGSQVILVIALISRRFSISVGTRRVILLTAIPVILLYAMIVITPDLLVALMMLIYFLYVFQPDYPFSKRNGIFCGLWGGFAYLAKAYSFPFFVIHFPLMNFLHYVKSWDRGTRLKVFANFFSGLAVFGVISGIWIAAISLKYHRVTYATVGGDYIMSFIRPGGRDLHPMSWQGFLAPPNQTAVSSWEDPSSFTYPRWSPFDSSDAFKYYLRHIKANFRKIYRTFREFSYLSVPIYIACILFLLQKPGKILTQYYQVAFPLISIFLFLWGYSLVFVEIRHIWVTFFLVLILGGYMMDRLFEGSFFTKTRKVALYIFFIISFAYRPAVINLPAAANVDKPYYLLSQELKKYIRPGDRIASNGEWNESLYLAYHLNVPYYGIPKENIDKQTLNEELHKFNINRYLIWDNRRLVNVEFVK